MTESWSWLVGIYIYWHDIWQHTFSNSHPTRKCKYYAHSIWLFIYIWSLTSKSAVVVTWLDHDSFPKLANRCLQIVQVTRHLTAQPVNATCFKVQSWSLFSCQHNFSCLMGSKKPHINHQNFPQKNNVLFKKTDDVWFSSILRNLCRTGKELGIPKMNVSTRIK